MSQLATYLAAGAALGAASEATGTTAFTSVGQQARDQQGDGSGGRGSGPSIDLDLGGAGDGGQGVSGDVLGQLADAFQQQQSGPSALEIAQLVQSASGNDGAASALSDALEQQQQRTEEWRRRWEAAQEGDLNGDGEKDTPDVPSLPDTPDLPDMPDVPGGGDDGGSSTLDKTARAGGQVEGAVRFIGEGANTLGTTLEALGGGDYSTENTYYGRWFDDGGKTRNIDYPDVPDLPDLPSLPSGKKDEEKAELWGFGGDFNPLGNSASEKSNDSSSSSSSTSSSSSSSSTSSSSKKDDDEPIISLPDEVINRNTGNSSRTVGFTR